MVKYLPKRLLRYHRKPTHADFREMMRGVKWTDFYVTGTVCRGRYTFYGRCGQWMGRDAMWIECDGKLIALRFLIQKKPWPWPAGHMLLEKVRSVYPDKLNKVCGFDLDSCILGTEPEVTVLSGDDQNTQA